MPYQFAVHARSRCTPTPSNIRYRYMLSELNHCPNFHIARLKFPEISGLAYCTRVARAQCITTPRVMDQRKALVESVHQVLFSELKGSRK